MAYNPRALVVRKRKRLFSFLGEEPEVHYADLIPPLPGEYTGPGPYTSMYPAPAMERMPKIQLTPEQAWGISPIPEMPQSTFFNYSYNPFAGLGFYENPLLDSEYVPPPPPPTPVPAPVVKPAPPVFSYNPFASFWKK